MAKVKHTREEVIEAIKGSAGIKSTVARKLRIHRHTFDNYLNRWKSVRQAYEDERSQVDDAAVSVVVGDIVERKNVETAKWWLRMKMGAEFAPIEKREISGPEKGPLIVLLSDDDSEGNEKPK